MGFQLVDYNLLAKNIRESIATELKSHKKRSLRALYQNHPERATQCRYLLAVLNCLDKVEQHDKARVLNAAAYYIHKQIFDSYQGTVTPYVLAPENSTLYNSLTTSLNLTTDNLPDSKDLVDMYSALEDFMQSHVYKNSDSSQGYLEAEKQVFSAHKIKGYKVEKVLKDLVQKIADLELKQIDTTKKQELVKEMPIDQTPGANLFGLFKPKPLPSSTISTALEDSSYTSRM